MTKKKNYIFFVCLITLKACAVNLITPYFFWDLLFVSWWVSSLAHIFFSPFSTDSAEEEQYTAVYKNHYP